jgi:hypothetical protein
VPRQAHDRLVEPGMREERKVATALFADLVGSAEITERLDPEDARELRPRPRAGGSSPRSPRCRRPPWAAGQAAAVAHVAAHELGAAAYAIKAARAASLTDETANAGRLECRWQRERLPDAIRHLVLDDQGLRNEICWSVFER